MGNKIKVAVTEITRVGQESRIFTINTKRKRLLQSNKQENHLWAEGVYKNGVLPSTHMNTLVSLRAALSIFLELLRARNCR